jgi:hypothetical protein
MQSVLVCNPLSAAPVVTGFGLVPNRVREQTRRAKTRHEVLLRVGAQKNSVLVARYPVTGQCG